MRVPPAMIEVRDGRGFGAPALRIGGVLDVAARMDTALFIAHGGADEEPGVGRVGFGARLLRTRSRMESHFE
jgi:hypothetical protein